MSKCYMCDDSGDTKEHVPPKTFFPPGYRGSLWTVPSCPKHNNNNSRDVEYVAGIIINAIESTGDALEESQKKVFRAFGYRKGLLIRTFKDVRPIRLPSGELTATFQIDLNRFENILKTIAYAIYFYTNLKRYEGFWKIVSPQLNSYETTHLDRKDERSFLFENLQEMSFVEINHPQPQVFKGYVYNFPDDKVVYKFEFYNGFIIYVIDSIIFEIITKGKF